MKVTILILIDGFLQCDDLLKYIISLETVTILILIDGFLQYRPQESIFNSDFESQSLF